MHPPPAGESCHAGRNSKRWKAVANLDEIGEPRLRKLDVIQAEDAKLVHQNICGATERRA